MDIFNALFRCAIFRPNYCLIRLTSVDKLKTFDALHSSNFSVFLSELAVAIKAVFFIFINSPQTLKHKVFQKILPLFLYMEPIFRSIFVLLSWPSPEGFRD